MGSTRTIDFSSLDIHVLILCFQGTSSPFGGSGNHRLWVDLSKAPELYHVIPFASYPDRFLRRRSMPFSKAIAFGEVRSEGNNSGTKTNVQIVSRSKALVCWGTLVRPFLALSLASVRAGGSQDQGQSFPGG